MTDQDQNVVKPADVKPLVDLLQYQDGSIVSRVLLKNKGGTVTLFAFDVAEGLSEHTAPFDALVVVTDGEAEIPSFEGLLLKDCAKLRLSTCLLGGPRAQVFC